MKFLAKNTSIFWLPQRRLPREVHGVKSANFCHTVYSKQERQHVRQGPVETLVFRKYNVNTQFWQ